MRLWHKELIPVLPDNQLRGQWRECCLIAKALHDGNLNHLLVNKVKEYPAENFDNYSWAVYCELVLRGVKVHSNWNTKRNVDIEVDGKKYTVNGNDLIQAVQNAMNTNSLC